MTRLVSPSRRLAVRLAALPALLALLALLALPGLPGAPAAAATPDDAVERVLASPPADGLVLTVVAPGSQAAGAGLREGDLLLSYGGAATRTLEDLARAIRDRAAEPRVELRFLRDGKETAAAVRGGQLGVLGVPVQKGKPIIRRPETPFEPNRQALQPGERFYHFLSEGRKVGFERHRLERRGDGWLVERTVRFKLGEFAPDLRMRMTLGGGSRLPVQEIRFTESGEPLADVKRAGESLRGTLQGKPVERPIPADLIPSYAVDLVALTMPRRVGACLHFSLLNEGELTPSDRFELYCAARETVTVGGREVEAFRYEASRLGTVTNRYWITEDHRVVRADYGGPYAELTSREEALRGLPEGVSGKL